MGLEYISDFTELISSLGAIPMVLTAEEHDFITAGVSHLPHIIASALVNLVKTLDNDAEYMKTIAAGGFRDITRIASSSPVMWQQICMENHENISNAVSYTHLDVYKRQSLHFAYSPKFAKRLLCKPQAAIYIYRSLFQARSDLRTGVIYEYFKC